MEHLLKTVPVLQIFGKDLTAQIEEAKKKEAQTTFQSPEELYAETDSFLLKIKTAFLEALEETRKYMYDIIKQYSSTIRMTRKDSFCNWDELKTEYQMHKEAFLRTKPGTESPELQEFIRSYSIITYKLEKQKKMAAEQVPQIKIRPSCETEVNTLIKSLKDLIAIFRQRFFVIKENDDLSEKFDPSKLRISKIIESDHKDGVSRHGLVLLKNLNYLVSAGKDGSLILWDALTFEQRQVLEEVHSSWIYSLAYSEKRCLLFTASGDSTIKVFKIGPRGIQSHVATLTDHTKGVHGLLVLDEQDLLVSCGDDPNLRLWRLEDLKLADVISTSRKGGMGCALTYIPKLGAVAVGVKDEGINVYSLSLKSKILEIKTDYPGIYINGMEYVEKKNLLIAEVASGKMKVWEIRENNKVIQLKEISLSGDYPGSFVVFPSCQGLVAASGKPFVNYVEFGKKSYEIQIQTGLKSCSALLHLPMQGKILVADRDSSDFCLLSYVD